MIRQKVFTVGLVALSLYGLGWAAAQRPRPPDKKPSEQAEAIVIRGCRVLWKDERTISSKIPGVIARIYVQEGDRVEPGMELARLDDREKRIEYAIQKLVGDSELAIRGAQARANEYKAEMDVAIKLFQKRAVSEEERRLSEVRYVINKVEAEREIENHKVEQLKAKQLKVQLDDHVIVSPMRGIVQRRYKREKEALTIAEGLQLFRIVDTDWIWVEGDVPVQYVYRVHNGQPVEVQLYFMSSRGEELDLPQARKVFKGKVVFVDPEVHRVDRTFIVRAEVRNQGEILRKGMTARMRILLGPPKGKKKVHVAWND